MTRREGAHLLAVLRGRGLKLTQESTSLYVGRCPSCGGRLEVHMRAPSPDLALKCCGRVELSYIPKASRHAH